MQKTYALKLERTPAMTLAGGILTNYYLGLIIVVFLVFLSVFFVIDTNFSLLSLLFLLVFTLPVFTFTHFRLVMRGKRAMKGICEIYIDDEQIIYESGYPNVLRPGKRTFPKKEIKQLSVKGNPLFGYFIQVQKHVSNTAPNPREKGGFINWGLWREPSSAINIANDLGQVLKVPVIEEFEPPENENGSL